MVSCFILLSFLQFLQGSSDSGKGCSDVASPPSRTPVGSGSLAGDADVDNGVESTSSYSVYDFLLPQLLVGRLIGRHGAFVHEIKAKTNATIWIKRHPETTKQKICSIEGKIHPCRLNIAISTFYCVLISCFEFQEPQQI